MGEIPTAILSSFNSIRKWVWLCKTIQFYTNPISLCVRVYIHACVYLCLCVSVCVYLLVRCVHSVYPMYTHVGPNNDAVNKESSQNGMSSGHH